MASDSAAAGDVVMRVGTLGCVALLVACGGDEGGGADLGDGEVRPDGSDVIEGDEVTAEDPYAIAASVPREALSDAIGRARCAFDARCEVGFAGVPASECVALAGAHAWYAEAITRLELEGFAYDPAATSECLRALASRPCDEVGARGELAQRDDGRDYFMRIDELDWYALPACRAALLGDGGPGEACLYNVECASGRCSTNGSIYACGQCVAATTCDTFEVCAADEICDLTTSTCVTRAARGEPCRGDRECRPGLRCEGGDLATGVFGVCAGLGELGRTCDTANFGAAWCPLGTRCDGRNCVAAQTTYADVGEPCGDAGACRPGLRCFYDDTPTCERLGEGDACSHGNLRVSPLARTDGCPLDLVCSEDEVCARPVVADGACRSSRDCDNGLFCEPESRQCKPRLGEGEVCSAYPYGQECAYPFTCVGSRLFGTDDGTCSRGADPGDSCSGNEDCGPDIECTSEGRCYLFGSYFGCQ